MLFSFHHFIYLFTVFNLFVLFYFFAGVLVYEMVMASTPFAPKKADNVTELFTNIAMVTVRTYFHIYAILRAVFYFLCVVRYYDAISLKCMMNLIEGGLRNCILYSVLAFIPVFDF